MSTMGKPLLYAALAALMIDSVIEVGFIGTTVHYLHLDGPYDIQGPDGTIVLLGKPANMSVNQGHTSNGAAGTALVLVGFLGLILLSTERTIQRSSPHLRLPLFLSWTVLTILSFLLTLSALIYTYVIIHDTSGQSINLSGLQSPVRYPYDQWTPQTWYNAVLQLPFVNENDKSWLRNRVRIMEGWRWNLIPLLVIGLVVMLLASAEFVKLRKSHEQIDEPKHAGESPPPREGNRMMAEQGTRGW